MLLSLYACQDIPKLGQHIRGHSQCPSGPPSPRSVDLLDLAGPHGVIARRATRARRRPYRAGLNGTHGSVLARPCARMRVQKWLPKMMAQFQRFFSTITPLMVCTPQA